MSIIHLEDVVFHYGDRCVLDELSLTLNEGERLGLEGSMGVGKTTLLHLIVGLVKPDAGCVHLFGQHCIREKDFALQRRRIGLVFQDSDDQLFCPTVIEDVAFGPLNLGLSPEQARERALSALDRVGLAGFEHRVTYRLSGGEKRLVALATVLSMNPAVLLLDEPQNGLDAAAAERVRSLLQSLDQSMVIVSHDHSFLEEVSTSRRLLDQGRLVQG